MSQFKKVSYLIIFFLPIFFYTYANLQNTNNNLEKKAEQTPTATPKTNELRGYIETTNDLEFSPEFRIIFNGKETTSDRHGFYSFNLEDKSFNKLRIFIVKDLEKNFKKSNTIKNFKINLKKPYKYFSIKKREAMDGDWQVEEKKLRKQNGKISQNSLVFLINPKYVETLSEWKIELDENFVKLPKLMLKNKLNHNKIKKESSRSLLNSLDMITFHSKGNGRRKISKSGVELTISQ